MGSQEIRNFIGGRHKDDKGLYVSTGGFSKDARYEAERASIPLWRLDLSIYPYLPRATVETTSAKVYMGLLCAPGEEAA